MNDSENSQNNFRFLPANQTESWMYIENDNKSKNKNRSKNGGGSKDQKCKHREIPIDSKQAEKQFKVTCHTTDVYFPVEPYEVQKAYMKQVIEALDNRQNGLLQSPTGTGQTLCLLTATLAWLSKKRAHQIATLQESQPIRIIYASRTHSQLRQVVSELKKTVYLPKMATLASRDQLCIKREFQNLRGTILNAQCLKAIKLRHEEESCNYFKPMQKDQANLKFMDKILDIEEMRLLGKTQKNCPYFYSRRVKDTADLLLMPYTYLLDTKVFGIFQLDLQNTIIIFDEAHNIQSVCEQGASLSISFAQLQELEKEIDDVQRMVIEHRDPQKFNKKHNQKLQKELKHHGQMEEVGLKTNVQDLIAIKGPVTALKNYLKKQYLDESQHYRQLPNGEEGYEGPGKQIFDLIFKQTALSDQEFSILSQKSMELQSNGTLDSYFSMQDSQSRGKQHLKEEDFGQFRNGLNLKNESIYMRKLGMLLEDLETRNNWGLDSWSSFLSGFFRLYQTHVDVVRQESSTNEDWLNNLINHFQLYIQREDERNVSINLCCLDPSQALQEIKEKGPYNIFLTSGTLFPFQTWQAELRTPFQVTLNNPHVIDTQQNLLAGILTKGPSGGKINFSFDERDNKSIYIDAGNAIINLCDLIPCGVLVIFSSYQLLQQCRRVWTQPQQKILPRLNEQKYIIWQPKNSNQLNEAMDAYKKKCQEKTGAILFAVCRGKISEGIDFTDELARAVILIGIPFPPVLDRKVDAKKQYLDVISTTVVDQDVTKFQGKDWYSQQMIRAMNQCIGRVIRHINDWGAVYLFDERFQSDEILANISAWVQGENKDNPVHGNLKIWKSFPFTLRDTDEFFSKERSKPLVKTNLNDDSNLGASKLVNDQIENEEDFQKTAPEIKKNAYNQKVTSNNIQPNNFTFQNLNPTSYTKSQEFGNNFIDNSDSEGAFSKKRPLDKGIQLNLPSKQSVENNDSFVNQAEVSIKKINLDHYMKDKQTVNNSFQIPQQIKQVPDTISIAKNNNQSKFDIQAVVKQNELDSDDNHFIPLNQMQLEIENDYRRSNDVNNVNQDTNYQEVFKNLNQYSFKREIPDKLQNQLPQNPSAQQIGIEELTDPQQ